MLARNRQKCGNCDAFYGHGPESDNPHRVGECHAGPPQMIPVTVPKPGSQLSPQGMQLQQGIQGIWPPTQAGKWCRKWSLKTDGEA